MSALLRLHAALPNAVVLLAMGACGDDAASSTDAADIQSDAVTTADAVDVADAAEVVIPPYDPPPISWSPCGEGGWTCGDLVVPRDYADPDGPTLRVKVSRHTASVPARRVGALLVNPGGPGGPAGGFARGVAGLHPDFAERYDIYGLDPRGTGDSEPLLACLTDEELDTLRWVSPRIDASEAEAMVGYVRAQCAALGAETLAAVGTTEVARDMDTLRKAIVEPQINYLGTSYGTILGAAYASLFPDRVRAFVLDAPVSDRWMELDMFVEGGRAKQLELERYFAWSGARDGGGTFGTGGVGVIRDRFRAMVDDCVAGEVMTPRGPLPPDDLIGVTAAMLASGSGSTAAEDAFSTLELLFEEIVESKDGSRALEIADTLAGRAPSGRYHQSTIANLATMCRDGLAGADHAAFDVAMASLATEAPDFANAYLYRACVGWGVGAAPPPVDAADAPPMLVLAGERDPSTPRAWSDELVEALGNGSQTLVWHGAGHAFVHRANVVERVLTFLEDPATLGVDPYVCPARESARMTVIAGQASVPLDLELRAITDDAILASDSVGTGPFELAVPASYEERWIVLRWVGAGGIIARRVLDLAAPVAPTLRAYVAADIASFSHDQVAFDAARGVFQSSLADCDGQGAIGARLVLAEAPEATTYYADGAHSCRFDTPAEEATRCGRVVVGGLAPGRYTLGIEHEEASFAGPSIVVEPGSFTFISSLSPR